MSNERDTYGFLTDPAKRMQQVMLGFYDLLEEAKQADFPSDLIDELRAVRLKFLNEFEHRFPGHGKGRAVWR